MQYSLKRNSRSKSIRIRIATDGSVMVSAPHHVSKNKIDEFVTSQRAWIEHHTKHKQETQASQTVLVLGKKYTQKATYDIHAPVGVQIAADELSVNQIPTRPNQAGWNQVAEKHVARFIKECAVSFITQQLPKWAQKMQITYTSISFKQMSSRWGSCSHSGALVFNWRLGHFDPQLIEYVIIHELAHRVHFDHSASFWKLVERFDPLYKTHRSQIKRLSKQIVW